MDIRYQQIERETETEKQSQQSLRAFTGFGRSSLLMSEVDAVLAENQKRVTQLSKVISIEEQIKTMVEQGASGESLKGIAAELSRAQSQLNEMSNAAAKRRAQISESLMGVGIAESRKQQAKLRFRNPFKVKRPKQLSLKPFSFKAARIESVKTLSGISQSLGKILSVGNHIVKPLSLLKASWDT